MREFVYQTLSSNKINFWCRTVTYIQKWTLQNKNKERGWKKQIANVKNHYSLKLNMIIRNNHYED